MLSPAPDRNTHSREPWAWKSRSLEKISFSELEYPTAIFSQSRGEQLSWPSKRPAIARRTIFHLDKGLYREWYKHPCHITSSSGHSLLGSPLASARRHLLLGPSTVTLSSTKGLAQFCCFCFLIYLLLTAASQVSWGHGGRRADRQWRSGSRRGTRRKTEET